MLIFARHVSYTSPNIKMSINSRLSSLYIGWWVERSTPEILC